MQAGGWSLTWQGDQTTNADYPNADTLLSAMRKTLGEAKVDHSADGTGVDLGKYDAVVMVAAEEPYAEMKGDIAFPASIRHSSRYPQDLTALQRVSGKGVPVVTLLFSGRPVAANDLINRSDAFVAAWLPGTEGLGLTDLLIAASDGGPAFDFVGRLPFSWPAGDCLPSRGGIQFERGHGLSLRAPARASRLPEARPTMACPAQSR
jgi:beta-glucosidase